jgi:hypothetical protein
MSRETKAFEDRIKQIEDSDESKKNIQATGGRQLFDPIKKNPAPEPRPTPADDGLEPPPLPELIRKRCRAKYPEETKRLEAEEDEVKHLKDQVDYFRREAATALKHESEYRELFKQALEAARRSEKRGEKQEAKDDYARAEKYKNDADFKKKETRLKTQKAEESERAANMRQARVREITQQLLKDCNR